MHTNSNKIALELIALRMSVAKLAQRLGVQSPELPVTGLDQTMLLELAISTDRGWNGLIQLCHKRIEEIKERHHKCLTN